MSRYIGILNLSRRPLRIGTTSIDPAVAGAEPTVVDTDLGAVRRDLQTHYDRYVVASVEDDTAELSGVINVINESGSNMVEGDLVYLSGYDAATDAWNITLADADGAGGNRMADFVLRDDIDNGDTGLAHRTHRLTGQATNAGSEGDPVYLSTTAGDWSLSAPTGADDVTQQVGRVAVSDASTGIIEFYIEPPFVVGTDQLRDASVTAGKLATGAAYSNLGATSTVLEMNELADIASYAQSTVAVAVEAGNAIAVTVTLKNAAGSAVTGTRAVRAWLSSSATTGAIASDDSITVTATTGSFLVEVTDDLIFDCVTDTTGVLVLSVAHAGDATAKYLWVDTNGFKKPKVSAVIDLA